MIKNQNILKNTTFTIIVLILVANIGMLIWYLFVSYQFEFHSDSAAKVLLAREIVETKNYFPKDWNYINNDFFVFFGHTFIIFLLKFMPAGFTAHAISGLILSILLFSGVWFVSGLIALSMFRRLVILAVVASGVSNFLAENLYGQVSYGVEVIYCCYLLFFSWRFIQSKGRISILWGVFLLTIILFAYWENPQRATIVYGLPFLGAICWLFWSGNTNFRKKIWQIMTIFFIGIAIGSVLHIYTLSNINNILTVGNASWLSYESMLHNLSLAPKGILFIFGGLPSIGEYFVSTKGIYEAVRLVVAVLTSFLVFWAVVRAFRFADGGLRFISSFVGIAFFNVFFLYVTTTIPDMTDPIQSSRYLVPSLFLGLILLLMSPIDRIKSPVLFFATIFITVFFILNSYQVFRLSGKNYTVAWGQPGQYDKRREGIEGFLLSADLKYGYATFWNAGVLSVLSNEKTLVRQITINNGIPVPMHHLSSNRWYRPEAWVGETFLLLTEVEDKLVNWEHLEVYNVKPERVYEFNGYKAYVFKDNLANHLASWSTRYEVPFKFIANKYSQKEIGYFDDDLGGLVAKRGEQGALHFGPYVRVEAGEYIVTFDVLADYNQDGVVSLDVVSESGQKVHAKTTLELSDKEQVFQFELTKPQILEFRVISLGNEQVVFKGVTIEKLQSAKNQ